MHMAEESIVGGIKIAAIPRRNLKCSNCEQLVVSLISNYWLY